MVSGAGRREEQGRELFFFCFSLSSFPQLMQVFLVVSEKAFRI